MKRKNSTIIFLITIVCIAFTGYIKGCNSSAYMKQYPASYPIYNNNTYVTLSFEDSTIKIPASKHYKRTKISQLIFGKHYRNLWALPVEMEVFNINKEKGGLKPLKLGGSMQTLNLRLESHDGKKYVLRSVDKDQSKALPPFAQNKLFVYIIRDQAAAINPYAALIVPKLASPVGIMSTNPELFYIPYEKDLNQYAELFEGIVAILEEYPDESWANSPVFNYAENIISTEELLHARFQSNVISIDEKEYVKARLFDLLINDWDRHSDQWRWAEYKMGNKKIYKPIPRDRDNAFFTFESGLIPYIVKAINPKFQSFNYNYNHVEGLIKNARQIDNIFISGITEETIGNIANELKKNLTDSIIETAVRSWPKEVYNLMGIETINKLKSRRDRLDIAAKEYYQLLFKEVKVIGTDDIEYFTVDRVNDQSTLVTMKDKAGNLLYQHTFNHCITKEVTIYGLGAADSFLVKGNVSNGMTIKIHGGEGYDSITDQSSVKGYSKKTKVYDTNTGNRIELGIETEDLTSQDPAILYFDRSGRK